MSTRPRPEGAPRPERLELVLLIGLPASGKTTFYREHLAATHGVVSKDLMTDVRQKSSRQRELARAALGAGHSLVVDDTNGRRQDREPLIALAHELGARVVGYFFSSRASECLLRNRRREPAARVREALIVGAARDMERPVHAEGFDELRQVLLRPAGYEVRAYRDPA